MRGRGRRGHSAVAQQRSTMPLRKRTNKDAPSESQRVAKGAQEDEDLSDGDDDKDEFSASLLSAVSTREKRRRERIKGKMAKDMSEQDMMDVALHLSEQEASESALRRQQENEAIEKAIQESMVSQTQPCSSSQSQSLLAEADASLSPCSQAKHLHKTVVSKVDQRDLNVCTSERNQSQVATQDKEENNNRIQKRKMREDDLSLELTDLPQTKRICSEPSLCDSGSLPVFFETGQSCDSTQIEEHQLHKSPVFPLTGTDSKAEIRVLRLSQDLLDTCKTSGFVMCSPDNSKTTNNSPPTQPQSPTFPKSPRNPLLFQRTIACPKSLAFSETDQGDDTETQISPEYLKSPVFGRTTQQDSPSAACKSHVSICGPTIDNSGCIYSSQESLTSSVGPSSCRPKSPVFPRTPSLPNNLAVSECSEIPQSAVFLEEDERHDKETTGPVLGKMFRPQKPEHDRVPTVCHRSSSSFEEIMDHSQNLRQDGKIKTNTSAKSDDAEDPNEISRDSSERELTSDMTLHWSDDDEDGTVVGSPSPVFPKESPVHQADNQVASLTHVAAATLEINEPNHRDCTSAYKSVSAEPSSTSATTTEQASQMGSSQDKSQAGPSTSRPTVHYYWGVPFCPRGLDADTYTQVILAQIEVYEKSLKQAQRCLLRKAEWGEGISPQPEKSPSPESPAESSQQPIRRRHGLRLRGRKLSEEADSPAVESEEDEEGKGKEEEEEEKRRDSKVARTESGGSIHLDPDDDEVCPETQLSDDSTQDLTMYIEDEPKSTKRPDPEIIFQDNNSVVDDSQDETEMEVDATVGKRLEGEEPVDSHGEGPSNATEEQQENEEEGREDLDVEEIKERELQMADSPELDPVAVHPSPESNVQCPICQGYFPVAKIEMHAAYCNGEVASLNKQTPEASGLQVSSKLRRARHRRADEEVNNTSNNSEIQEKCCTCQRIFPQRVYSRHKELCTQQHTSKTPSKIVQASAMEQKENTDSEASLTHRMMMKRRRWGVTEHQDSKSETHPSDYSLHSQKSPVAVVTSKCNSEPRRHSLIMKGKKLSGEPDSQRAESGEEEEKEEEACKKIMEEEKIVKGSKRAVEKSRPRPQSTRLPDVEVTLQEEDPTQDNPLEGEGEVNATMDRHIREQPVATEEMEQGSEDPDDEEIQRKGREVPRSTSADPDPVAVSPSSGANVKCPICQGSFPAAKIEMHAAYCDGEVAVVDKRKPEATDPQASLKSRRSRTRRAAEEVNNSSNNSEYQEKCYVCQKFVPLKIYSRHTELCTQRFTSKAASRGNLLSALRQTESMDSEAGPSWSRANTGDVIELQDDDDEEDEMVGDGASRYKISNSPIRSFTPISEATDCLIDFKRKQRAKKPSQRRK